MNNQNIDERIMYLPKCQDLERLVQASSPAILMHQSYGPLHPERAILNTKRPQNLLMVRQVE